MKIAALFCAAVAVCLPAFALSADQGPTFTRGIQTGTMNADMPPERFRGNSISVVVFTDRAGIEDSCGRAAPGFVILACHRETTEGVSVIFMANPCPAGEFEHYAKIMCHENGHANGWTAEHEL